MAPLSFRARLARWIGGNAVKSAEKAAPALDATEEGLPDRESLALVERVRLLEAEWLDVSVQWSDLNDAVRKWSARLASQKAAETRKSLAAIETPPPPQEELGLDGQPDASADADGVSLEKRAAMKAELARRWASRRR